MAQALNNLAIAEIAYPAPVAAPPPSAPLYSQVYRGPASPGIDAAGAVHTPGGWGSDVTVLDIEYSWHDTHEDLDAAQGHLIPNGAPVDPFADDNHGTAVLGELVASRPWVHSERLPSGCWVTATSPRGRTADVRRDRRSTRLGSPVRPPWSTPTASASPPCDQA
ncbi:MAG: hypothetical protein JO291_11135 [Acidimicrobiia bacterium]|nr:hypothetical protein [Acidimicrobiia bacterium]